MTIKRTNGSVIPKTLWLVIHPNIKDFHFRDLVDEKELEQLRLRCEELEHKRQPECADPIPLLLWCPICKERHIDENEFATRSHHTHACQHCGHVWRPALVPTVGVQFLPGFKNEPVAVADQTEKT